MRHALESRRVLAPLLIGPAVLFMVLVVGVPFGWAIYLSFTNAIGGSLSGDWVGFDNFTSAWDDENFRRALRNTFIFTLASQAIVLVGAAVLSNFLVRDFRGRWIVRFLVVLPWAAPVVLSTIGWLWIYDSLFSVVNWVAKQLHLVDQFNPPQWLGDPTLALAAEIRKLIGIEMKMRQYEIGEQFITHLENTVGIEALDAAWRGPENLPTLAELEAPERWLERVGSLAA